MMCRLVEEDGLMLLPLLRSEYLDKICESSSFEYGRLDLEEVANDLDAACISILG